MTAAKLMPSSSAPDVISNSKVVMLNVMKFPIRPPRPSKGRTSRQPSIPPSKESSSDSKRNESSTLPREKPNILRTPTSRARRATAAYIVFIAAKLLPMAMMIETNTPRT